MRSTWAPASGPFGTRVLTHPECPCACTPACRSGAAHPDRGSAKHPDARPCPGCTEFRRELNLSANAYRSGGCLARPASCRVIAQLARGSQRTVAPRGDPRVIRADRGQRFFPELLIVAVLNFLVKARMRADQSDPLKLR